jgi:hypothetical protein
MVAPQHPALTLKVHKLIWAEMVDHQLKGLCYNCDEKYSPWHKCNEHKLFISISKDDIDGKTQEEVTPIIMEVSLLDQEGEEPQISLHSLDIYSPQTLKLVGYKKQRKVIILMKSSNTHNFIHFHVSLETTLLHPCY